LQAVFVVPMAQVRILDFPYQLYAFEVFHMAAFNRWMHFVGIPTSLAATYVLLSPIRGASLLALVVVAGIQVGICLRARFHLLIPVVLLVHGALWLAALHWASHLFVFGKAWWRHPAFHVVLWPMLQYLTHLTEQSLPPPWSGTTLWIGRREYFSTTPPLRIMRAFAFGPLHAGVELVSSHRNFFLLLVLVAERLGYRPDHLVKLRAWITAECQRVTPVIDYDEFRQARSARGEQRDYSQVPS
jgi:hypothetical protein